MRFASSSTWRDVLEADFDGILETKMENGQWAVTKIEDEKLILIYSSLISHRIVQSKNECIIFVFTRIISLVKRRPFQISH